MAEEMSDDQKAEFRKCFEIFDADGSGNIEGDELRGILRRLGQEPTDEEIAHMIAEVDSGAPGDEGYGEIDFDEFLDLMAKKMKQQDAEEEIVESFKVLDTDEKGYLTPKELMHFMTTKGDVLTEDEVNEMISEASWLRLIDINSL